VPDAWQIGHENPGKDRALISLTMGGTQYGTPCQDGFCDAAHKRIWHPQDASSARAETIVDGNDAIEAMAIASNFNFTALPSQLEE
jgi:hypothetical protein